MEWDSNSDLSREEKDDVIVQEVEDELEDGEKLRLQSLNNKISLKNLIHRHLLRPVAAAANEDDFIGICPKKISLAQCKTSHTSFSPHTLITFSSDGPRIPYLYSCYRKSKDFDDVYRSCDDSDEDDDDYGRRGGGHSGGP
ncbi:hypothetical protein KY290_032612 [Solanum tuberosum]|uniref:Uncharacterized protein n=1 Tax=Solanum tuberosum TaxID=4113 RepID=A0ABQ7UE84_SOLTU|nr:hypothetical protein KY290_032612 [Solanum tuberosum]